MADVNELTAEVTASAATRSAGPWPLHPERENKYPPQLEGRGGRVWVVPWATRQQESLNSTCSPSYGRMPSVNASRVARREQGQSVAGRRRWAGGHCHSVAAPLDDWRLTFHYRVIEDWLSVGDSTEGIGAG